MKIILRPRRPATIRVLSALALHVDLKPPDVKTVRRESGLKSIRTLDEKIVRLHSFRHDIRVHRMIDDG